MSSCEAMLVSDRYPMNKDNAEYKLSSLAIILGKPGDFQIREPENVSIHSKAYFFFFEKLSAISLEVEVSISYVQGLDRFCVQDGVPAQRDDILPRRYQ